jgi:acetoacetyl-CoA synthetase
MADSPLWTPSTERALGSNLAAFARATGHDALDWPALYAWSIDDLSTVWRALWDFCEIVGDPGPGPWLVEEPGNLAAARFFPGATLNVAENLMARLPDNAPALVAYDESGRVEAVDSDDLRGRVAAVAAELREAGVGEGDRVAAMLPNGPEAIVAMLAATSIGAVFSSASPDFGAPAVLDRFGQIEPVVLIGCASYCYNGRSIDTRAKLAEIAGDLPTVRRKIVVGEPGVGLIDDFVPWGDILARHVGAVLTFTRLPFDHPWYVLFSSGTTGKPKCIVHRAGGVLLMHAKEHRIGCDVKPGDVVTYYTTLGWMMWNWLASALATGATVVLYDGSPAYPNQHRLFEIAEAEGITLFGTSAKFIDGLATAELDISGAHDLSSVRTICSTGSPLSPRGFEYVYASIKPDVHLASISGGTDLCGCFVGGISTQPVWSGELQGPALAMAVQFFDESGRALAAGDGAGELVCTRPFPSQPLGLWGDEPFGPNGPTYQATYYERFPGVWAHGDFASWTEHGGAVIHGRSDATLNPGGVRIGTADLYRVVEEMPEVVESIAFGQNVDNDVRIALAVRLAEGLELDDALVASIKSRIRNALSPRHVPGVIVAVDDLPRTFSGKLVELAVADIVNGRPVRNRGAIANPEALDALGAHPGLRLSQ